MKVIESFTCSKYGDPARNEDSLVITGDFIAVIDGATDKFGTKINGLTGGRFASEMIAREVSALPADIKARAAVDRISAALKAELDAYKKKTGDDFMGACAGVTIYSAARREIWRIADGRYAVDGSCYYAPHALDDITSGARALVIAYALEEGKSEKSIAQNDPGREFITPLLKKQHLLANKDHVFGYGVIDGQCVPDRYLDIFALAEGEHEIILASDGYPEILPDLAQTERRLSVIQEQDPLLYRLHRSTKGWYEGQDSFDDRSYVRFCI